MALIALLVGGALVNALAFSGSNCMFSLLRSSGVDEERKCHDKAIEQLQAVQASWSQKRTEHLNWITEEPHHQGDAVHTFQDINAAIRKYAQVVGDNRKTLDSLGPEPLHTNE